MTDTPLSRYRQALRRLRLEASRSPRLERLLGERVVPTYGRVELFLAKRWRRYGRSAYALTRRNTRRGYEDLYASDAAMAEYVSPERVALYAELAGECARLGPRSLIDVGCGSGHFLLEVEARLGPSCRLAGVDHARTGVERLSKLVPQAEAIVADIYDLDLGGRTFDVVVCMEVLEHLSDPQRAIETLGRLRHHGSIVLITVPDGEHDTFEGHENFWTLAELEELLAPLGHVSVRRHGGDLIAMVS